ncbi:MAG: hypothetical protein HQM10_13020 [Candidatus Riflebacteria bacterium]|nr:hypothetical protein [Candidatus Riflebacteria bacterium]
MKTLNDNYQKTILITTFSAMIILFSGFSVQLNAQEADPFALPENLNPVAEQAIESKSSDLNQAESEQTELLGSNFKLENEYKDPFRPLIVKKHVKKDLVQPQKKVEPVKVEPAPIRIKPLELTLQGICGNEEKRLAMVVFQNRLQELVKGQEVAGEFKVVDILPDKLIVYSEREQLRKTFQISAKEKH